MEQEKVYGVTYSKPTVILMQETGIGTSEYAARTAYDSFDKSENDCVKIAKEYADMGDMPEATKGFLNNIEHSDLLDDLAWTYFHHSVLEHACLTYLIKGTSRGVLQELARHRIASYTVRSTRYTMSSVINAFNASLFDKEPEEWFVNKMINLDMLVLNDEAYEIIEWESAFKKLKRQVHQMSAEEWEKLTIPKKCEIDFWKSNDPDQVYTHLESLPKKKNIGDAFKHLVTDNWKVDLVMTINLRSLKNLLDLRDSGSAYFQIRWLAQEIKRQTPKKYLKLISKKEASK